MYLFYADRTGWIPMGNDGQLVVPKCIRSPCPAEAGGKLHG